MDVWDGVRNVSGAADVREAVVRNAPGHLVVLGGFAWPIWATAWVSLIYASTVLVGTTLPMYGTLLKSSWWWVLLLQFFVCMGVAAYLDASRRGGAWHWVVASITGPATAFFFAMGVVFLLTGTFGPISIGIAGGFGLGILVWAETIAATLEAGGRSVRDVLSS